MAYRLRHTRLKVPLDTGEYLFFAGGYNSSEFNVSRSIFFVATAGEATDNYHFYRGSTALQIASKFNDLFIELGVSTTRCRAIGLNTTTFDIQCDADDSYFHWNTTVNYAQLLENWTLTSGKAVLQTLTPVVSAAISDQLNNIALSNIDFVSPVKSETYLWSGLAIVGDTYEIPIEAELTPAALDLFYDNYIASVDNVGFPSNNFLSLTGDIDRHAAGNALLLYSISTIENKWLFGYSVTHIPTVQKWDVMVFSGQDGKSATLSPVIISMPQGGEADINVILSWSIDGVNYYPIADQITGLQPRVDYTVYIKDQFNGIKSVDFTTTVTGKLADPYLKIENANSLKFYEVNGAYPFFDNSKFTDQLYYNVEKQCYFQKIKQSNVITTQIKSTYETVTATVKTLQGSDVLTPDVILKVKNTEVQDKRDCTFKRSADGTQVYVYFEGGSQYTPGTTDVINTYYNSSTLPPFCEVGINVQLFGGVKGGFEVVGVLWESNLARYVMVVNAVLPDSTPVYGTCESTYNLELCDILEFDTVFATLTAGYYYIEVSGTDTDPRFLPVTWRSEPIKVAADFKFNNVIKYFNTENINQIDYSTGITHELNMAGRFIQWSPKGDVTRFNGDDGATFTLKTVKKRVVIFESGYIPQYLAEKLIIAGGHDTLTINGIECRMIEDAEIESNIEKNNPFYTVSMQLQLNEGIEITDSMGVVSESAAVLGATSTKVIGV